MIIMQLTESSPRTEHALLRVHQQAALHEMQFREAESTVTFITDNKRNTIYSTLVQVLGLPPGSGKTRIIGALVQGQDPICHPKQNYGWANLSVATTSAEPRPNGKTCIVVPHTLIHQWVEELDLLHVRFALVKERRQIDALDLDDDRWNTLLISSTMAQAITEVSALDKYPDWMPKFTVHWSRMVFDEAHEIKIRPNFPHQANMIWLVTATPCAHISNLGIMKYMLKPVQEFIDHVPNVIDINATHSFLENSMRLPEMISHEYTCLTPGYLRMLQHSGLGYVTRLLNAGCLDQAAEALGCETGSHIDFVKAATEHLVKKRDRLQERLNWCVEYGHENPNDDAFHQQIGTTRSEISKCNESITSIKERMDQQCVVCYEDPVNRTLVPCCHNPFCFECIIQSLGHSRNRCPCCRTTIDPKTLRSEIGNNQRVENPEKNKNDQLLEIIQNKPNGKFLVFADFYETYTRLKYMLSENNISYELVKGKSEMIQHTIQRFAQGEKNVLLLNSEHHASGLNLQMASDVILMHRLNSEREKQAIGRAQRIGRQDPLHVHRLLHHDE